MTVERDYNVFVGSSTGVLKGVEVSKESIGNVSIIRKCFTKPEDMSNKNEITCMNWTSEQSGNDILIGMKNRVKSFNVSKKECNLDVQISGNVNGIFSNNDVIVVALDSGIIRSWNIPYKADKWKDLKVASSVERMRRSDIDNHIVAIGGKCNDLTLWDLNCEQTVFNAKNIKPDKLQIQAPIWISDLTFFTDNQNVATCSKHGFVRLYDPLLPQRRPVLNILQEDQSFTCICATPDKKLLVGSGCGELQLVDLRVGNKPAFLSKFKGFSGSVKSVAYGDSCVMTASYDRHFRIHDFHSRKLLVKEYMQSHLTWVLPRKNFKAKEMASAAISQSLKRRKLSGNDTVEEEEGDGVETTLDDIFGNMEEIREENVEKIKKSAKNKKTMLENKSDSPAVRKISWKISNKSKN